jgi:hypothetical protein
LFLVQFPSNGLKLERCCCYSYCFHFCTTTELLTFLANSLESPQKWISFCFLTHTFLHHAPSCLFLFTFRLLAITLFLPLLCFFFCQLIFKFNSPSLLCNRFVYVSLVNSLIAALITHEIWLNKKFNRAMRENYVHHVERLRYE